MKMWNINFKRASKGATNTIPLGSMGNKVAFVVQFINVSATGDSDLAFEIK